MITFEKHHLDCICLALRQSANYDKLEEFLKKHLPNEKYLFELSEEVLIAKATVAYRNLSYEMVFEIIQSRNFDNSNHSRLQYLWYQAHYAEAQSIRGRSLRAVEKYRLRKKYPLPRTIWDGEDTVYCFKTTSRHVLKNSFNKNQYPCHEEKQKISQKTGLTILQIGNWFKNRRQRNKTNYFNKLNKGFEKDQNFHCNKDESQKSKCCRFKFPFEDQLNKNFTATFFCGNDENDFYKTEKNYENKGKYAQSVSNHSYHIPMDNQKYDLNKDKSQNNDYQINLQNYSFPNAQPSRSLDSFESHNQQFFDGEQSVFLNLL